MNEEFLPLGANYFSDELTLVEKGCKTEIIRIIFPERVNIKNHQH